MYAVIETGGKQYRVSAGEVLEVEKLVADVGSQITFERVLLISGDGLFKVGTPIVSGATVTATIVAQTKAAKVFAFKYFPKKRIRRKRGHRQQLTRLQVNAIMAGQ